MPNNQNGESLRRLLLFFLGDATFDETLQSVVELAKAAIPEASMVGITTLVDHKLKTAFVTEDEMVEIDRAQNETGEGPCVYAFQKSEVVTIEDMVADSRWPTFTATASEHGIKSSLSLPMASAGRSIGSLNLYSRQASLPTDVTKARAFGFAAQGAIVLANTRGYWDSDDLDEDLRLSIKRRAVIEQAKGILMARSNVSADKAFDLLKQASQKSNRKLRDIATELVESIDN